MHDVTKSSNPDVQALVEMNRQLGIAVLKLTKQCDLLADEIGAIRGELAALPQEYVVPGPNGEHPPGTIVVGAKAASVDALVGDFRGVVADMRDVSPLAAAGVV